MYFLLKFLLNGWKKKQANSFQKFMPRLIIKAPVYMRTMVVVAQLIQEQIKMKENQNLAVVLRCSVKKVFLKILQYSEENSRVGASF